ncbi:MAG: addiction module protein [Bacteroidota bacterium]
MRQLESILKLSTLERITLIEQIWDSIDKEDIPITSSLEKELNKRLTRLEKGETEFSSWNEVKKKLRKQSK